MMKLSFKTFLEELANDDSLNIDAYKATHPGTEKWTDMQCMIQNLFDRKHREDRKKAANKPRQTPGTPQAGSDDATYIEPQNKKPPQL